MEFLVPGREAEGNSGPVQLGISPIGLVSALAGGLAKGWSTQRPTMCLET